MITSHTARPDLGATPDAQQVQELRGGEVGIDVDQKLKSLLPLIH